MIARRASPCVDSSQRIVRDSGTPSKLRSQSGENIEAHFLERAKYYQFAAAMTENPQEIERLCDIAFMFERMAHDVRRLRLGQSRFPASGGAAGFVRIWDTLAEFVSLSMPR